MCLIFLPRVDGVSEIAKVGIRRIQGKNRDESRNIGKTVITNSEKRKPVIAGTDHTLAIEFVLLPVFQPNQEPISVRARERHPRIRRGAKSRDDINVPVISGHGDEWIEARPKSVGCCQIDRMISFANVKRSAVDLDTLEDSRDKYVGIGIAIAMGIRR